MEQPLEIPIFPLGSVLYPAGRLALRIFEPRYVEMTQACIRDGSVFGVTLIRAGFEVGTPALPCEVGCTARILQWQEPAPQRFELIAQGESVFRILRRRVTDKGLIMAHVSFEEPPDPTPVPERHQALRDMLARLIDQAGAKYFPPPHRLDDAAWVGNRLCELLPGAPEQKQALLELRDSAPVLDRLEQLLRRRG
jgi:Lon protease-like protein